MVTLETFHLREAILALSQHYNIWGCNKIFHSQNESETSSILASEEGRHLTWGMIDEKHKGSDFLKEFLTT